MSTTLRMIARLESITEVNLLIDGVGTNRVPAKDRDVAMVFQCYALYPHMTVAANLAFGLLRRDMRRSKIEQRIATPESCWGLIPLLHRKSQALSGRQRRRVGLGDCA